MLTFLICVSVVIVVAVVVLCAAALVFDPLAGEDGNGWSDDQWAHAAPDAGPSWEDCE